MFEGFVEEQLQIGEVELRLRRGGSGSPVLLLHGHPRTHATWHRVAPLLVEAGHTVVCPDLRGYGRSSKPPSTSDHRHYAKRAMALDGVRLMGELGFERFAVVGHDRGAYVAYRMALDHPDRITRLVAADGIPILEALERCDARFAAAWWHWWFLGQTDKPAERMISASPWDWYGPGDPEVMGREAHADWRRAMADPEVVRGMCEDYRAGLGIDRDHDEADRRAGRRITCPTMCLWSTGDDLEQLYGDPVAIWRRWCDDVVGEPVASGHHMAEEAPGELARLLAAFLGGL